MKLMKKTIILFAVIVSCILSAHAESYTLRGGDAIRQFCNASTHEIVDDLTIIEEDGLPAITIDDLKALANRVDKIVGTLQLEGIKALTSLSDVIDNIDCSDAGFILRNNTSLTDVNVIYEKGYTVINGDFIIDGCPNVLTGAANSCLGKSFSQIEQVKGTFQLSGLTSAISKPEMLLPKLETVDGNFIVNNCTRLYYFSNTNSTADMPLKYIGGDLVLKNNSVLQRLNGFGTLKRIGGNVTIMDNGGIPNGSEDDVIIGWCKISYYILTGVIDKDAVIAIGTTSRPLDISSIPACPCEIIEDIDGTYTAIPAIRFLSSIGVNSAINSRGENVNTTQQIMKYIGARWIRTTMGGSLNGPLDLKEIASSGGGNAINVYKKLYEESGIRFSAGLGAGGIETNVDNLIYNMKRVINATSPDIFIAVEGNNEPNNGSWYVIFEGEIGGGNKEGKNNWKPVARMQKKLYEDVKADPVLGINGYNYPVWDLTYGGAEGENVGLQYLTVPEDEPYVVPEFRGVTFADVANLHNYFSHPSFRAPQNNQTWRAAEPGTNVPPGCDVLYRHYGRTWLNKYMGYQTDEELYALPRVTTETGVKIENNITEEMQGLMYVSCYLSQFARGFSHTSIYLLSDRRDESGNQSFGIYDKYYNPRLAAHYLHNLTTVIDDDKEPENLGTLSYSITGNSVYTHQLLLQKSDGTFELIIWGERYLSGVDHIKVSFEQTYDEIWLYNVKNGTEPEQILKNCNELELDVIDHPYIIEIGRHPDSSGINQISNNIFEEKYYDLLGRCVYQHRHANHGEVPNLTHLRDGIYIRMCKDANGKIVHTEKIVVTQ